MKKFFILLITFLSWGSLGSLDSIFRVSGARDMYSFYGLEIVYYLIASFMVVGGCASVYAILKEKSWFFNLSIPWFIVGILNTIFTTMVSIFNKPLLVSIFKSTGESRGKEILDIEQFINSTFYDVSIVLGLVVLIAISIFFIRGLYKNKAYFKN